jgi:hypothetical protein
LDRPGPEYPVLLTPRDTAGEKEIEVFRGAGEGAQPLGLTALEGVIPAPVDPATLKAALATLGRLTSGGSNATPEALASVIQGVLPGFRHIAAEARLDDRI